MLKLEPSFIVRADDTIGSRSVNVSHLSKQVVDAESDKHTECSIEANATKSKSKREKPNNADEIRHYVSLLLVVI
jgi:hypothetical protein